MPRCPRCESPLTPGRLMRITKRRFRCESCGVALNITALYVLLPAFALAFLGAPLVKSVEAGVMGVVPAVFGGAALLVALTLLGYRLSSARLAKERSPGKGASRRRSVRRSVGAP